MSHIDMLCKQSNITVVLIFTLLWSSCNISKYLRGTAVSKKSPKISFSVNFPSKGKFSINNFGFYAINCLLNRYVFAWTIRLKNFYTVHLKSA